MQTSNFYIQSKFDLCMSRNYYPRVYMTEYIKVKLDPNHFHKKRFVYKSKLSPQANHSIFPVVFHVITKAYFFPIFHSFLFF